MKQLLKALDIPLYMTAGMVIASLLSAKNIFAEEPAAFAGCFIGIWGVSYLIRRYKMKKRHS